ncbi:hypothetical protein CAPTEDRAFT_212468 [Capitella teleta]|uniref:Reverse transcriptase domain-containing protein n=1 Tax=Capitella teleta TaxID=283909 RepID=R7U7C0_CAPTE|nr:hypothetical protein CAPTEDRAFT_212468 [Capitella teleta]|eukprot:ELT99035.1 hypothetical protein CAPTEDRAFT_212468 [Capitella teleta]
MDDHEQYSRRNSLRLSGVAELPYEDPADVVLATLNTRMKLDPPLVTSELDRTHRVGPKAKGGGKHRSLLIKFATYRSRKRVFTPKKQLWSEDQSDARLFLNEDLTKRRSELLWKARKLKKEGCIRDVWSSDGKLLLKTMNNVIHPFRSIEEIMLRASPLSEVVEVLEEGHVALGVLLDFQKAFDTVQHNILLRKLTNMEYVGSVLGINDITNVSPILHFVLFADDTNVFISNSDEHFAASNMNHKLKKLSLWFRANRLMLNTSKTNFIAFSTQRKLSSNIALLIDGVPIKRVESAVFLGVVLDEKLRWNFHIQRVRNKISRTIGIFSKLNQIFPRRVLITFYYSLVFPNLTYGIEVWGAAADAYIKPSILLQKKIVRIITLSYYRAHSDPVFTELKIAKFNDIYTEKVHIRICTQ